MKLRAVSTMLLALAAGCGNDRRAPEDGLASGGSSAAGSGGSRSDSAKGGSGGTTTASAGAAGAPQSIDDLCDADCEAQRDLSCVDASTCLDRCQLVYSTVGEQGCGAEYVAMLECVADVDPEAYVCLDSNTFGFDESSPCFEYSKTLSACLEAKRGSGTF